MGFVTHAYDRMIVAFFCEKLLHFHQKCITRVDRCWPLLIFGQNRHIHLLIHGVLSWVHRMHFHWKTKRNHTFTTPYHPRHLRHPSASMARLSVVFLLSEYNTSQPNKNSEPSFSFFFFQKFPYYGRHEFLYFFLSSWRGYGFERDLRQSCVEGTTHRGIEIVSRIVFAVVVLSIPLLCCYLRKTRTGTKKF
jgi:hypothetical protein